MVSGPTNGPPRGCGSRALGMVSGLWVEGLWFRAGFVGLGFFLPNHSPPRPWPTDYKHLEILYFSSITLGSVRT